MLRPGVSGACKGVVDYSTHAICVGGEVAAAAALTRHFCPYKRRGLTRERNFFLSLCDLTARETRRVPGEEN